MRRCALKCENDLGTNDAKTCQKYYKNGAEMGAKIKNK